MTPEDTKLICEAAAFFEHPGTFIKMLGFAGNRIEDGLKRLPEKWQSKIQTAATVALEKCLWAAVKTIATDEALTQSTALAVEKSKKSSDAHTAATAVTGAVSGFLGPEMLIVELPLTTSIMMRSIATTAQDFGFDLKDPETLFECLFVFAIGGPSKHDDGMNSSYLSSRIGFQSAMRAATTNIAGLPLRHLLLAVEDRSAPALVKLIAYVADNFGVRVGEKLIAQMAPVIGAVGGAGINVAFSDYFGKAARYHFALKKLAREHGEETVHRTYESASLKRRRP